MALFDENIELIKSRYPEIHAGLGKLSGASGISIFAARDGNPVPVMEEAGKKLSVHSKFDPLKESERFISEIDPMQFDLFIIFGFGFGYHIEELLKRAGRDSTVLVLEKSPWMIREAAGARDLSFLLGDDRVKIIINPSEDDIIASLKGRSSYRVTFLMHRGSFQLDPVYYSNLRRIARSFLSTKEVNIATLAKFERSWSANISRNIGRILSLPGANIFFEKFTGRPAIVAAAGPSLTESMKFIRENQGKAVVIAVDTSYGILKKNGIEPHFCVTVDPQVINSRYFEGDSGGRTVMIADPMSHPSAFRLFRGKTAVTGMAFQMLKWIEAISGEKGELAYGGSVSTNAYDFARRLSATPIVLVGQDLAFTGGLAHARGSYLDEQIYHRTGRFYNQHMFNRYQLRALPPVFIRGIVSPRVQTNQKMIIFLNWFEKRNNPDLINATSDGAFIPGVRHVSADGIQFPDGDADIIGAIHEIYDSAAQGDGPAASKRKNFLERCAAMESDLHSLMPALRGAVDLSDELVKIISSGVKDRKRLDHVLGGLSDTDRLIQSRESVKDMIGFTIQRVIHTITEGYEIDGEDSSLGREELTAKRSSYLYRGLLDGLMYNMKILEKMTAVARQGII